MIFPRRARLLGLLLAVAVVLGGCASNAPQDTLQPEGKMAREIDDLIDPVFAIAGVVFVVVLGGALFVSLKFRVRDDEQFDDLPAQIHGHNSLEIGWTILPALVLGVVGVFSVAGIFSLNEEPPEGSVSVEVIGHQWWWEYRYDLDGDGVYDEIITANDLVIPAGEEVALRITSRDVIHSFWVPKLNGKRDAVPNRVHPWKIHADAPGEYVGQCAEFCGLSHAEMRIKVVALERAEYDAWVEAQQTQVAPYAEDDESEEAKGYRVFTQQLCASCHLISGINDDMFSDADLPEWDRAIRGGPGTIVDPSLQASRHAPNLTHFMSRTTFAGAKFNLRRDTPECKDLGVNWAATAQGIEDCLDRVALEAWLRDPPAEKSMAPEGVPGRSVRRGMPDLDLPEDQIDQMVAFLKTLK